MEVLGFEQLTGISSAKGLQSIPAGTRQIWMQAEGQHVRYRFDGTAPTTAIGMRLLKDVNDPTVLNAVGDCLSDLKFIEESATGKVNVTYFGTT